jgi:hypothetical protein
VDRLRNARWALYAWLVLAIGGTIWFALAHPSTADAIEAIWTCMGTGPGVFALSVWRRRMYQDSFRRKHYPRDVGLRLATQDQVWLRAAGVFGELLIAISGFSAMLTPPSVRLEVRTNDLIVAWCLIGLGAIIGWSSWFADRSAQAQSDYYLRRRRPVQASE